MCLITRIYLIYNESSHYTAADKCLSIGARSTAGQLVSTAAGDYIDDFKSTGQESDLINEELRYFPFHKPESSILELGRLCKYV